MFKYKMGSNAMVPSKTAHEVNAFVGKWICGRGRLLYTVLETSGSPLFPGCLLNASPSQVSWKTHNVLVQKGNVCVLSNEGLINYKGNLKSAFAFQNVSPSSWLSLCINRSQIM